METNRFYKHDKTADGIIRIASLSGEWMYLVEGEDQAVLIDTSVGYGDFGNYVKELTDKPLSVILTHGHVDHAMGAGCFDSVHMHPADLKIYQMHREMGVRQGYMKAVLKGRGRDIEFMETSREPFLPLQDGRVFDLGGLHLELHHVPGHTPGSMVVLFRELRTILLGDACNDFTFLFDETAASVESYKGILEILHEKTAGRYDRVYLSHGSGESSTDMVPSVIRLCDEIMAGQADEVPFEFMGQQAYIAKAMGSDMKRIDGGVGNIVYSKQNIRTNREDME